MNKKTIKAYAEKIANYEKELELRTTAEEKKQIEKEIARVVDEFMFLSQGDMIAITKLDCCVQNLLTK
ncbi:MAG: hypothetical protein RR844_08740 [Clostridium sp.]